MSTNNRIEYIDLAKGICIFLIIFHHINTAILKDDFIILNITKIFRVPLYFVLSGLFFKTYGSFENFILKKTNKLLVPFCFFFLTTSICLPKLLYLFGTDILYGSTVHFDALWSFTFREFFQNVPIWFLLCLFEVNILFYFIHSMSMKLKVDYQMFFILLVSLFFGGLGFFLSKIHFNLPCFLDSAISALPFFAIGYFLKKSTTFLQVNEMDRFAIIFVLLGFSICFCINGNIDFLHNFFATSYLNVLIGGIGGTLSVLYLAKKMRYIPLISYCGRYSIIILVTHHILILLFRPISFLIGISATCKMFFIFILVIILEFPIILLFRKYLPYVTAQRDLIALK